MSINVRLDLNEAPNDGHEDFLVGKSQDYLYIKLAVKKVDGYAKHSKARISILRDGLALSSCINPGVAEKEARRFLLIHVP